jgi:hypothetical protein
MSVSLTVMTFNLHDDEPQDSPNSWEKRRDICISVITSYSPIILCTQQGSFSFSACPSLFFHLGLLKIVSFSDLFIFNC